MAVKKKIKLDKKIQKILKRAQKSRNFTVGVTLLLIVTVLYFGRGVYLAAVVDGRPITRFEVIRELEKQSGQETLDNLVSRTLLFQEAQRRGVQISNEVIQEEIRQIESIVESQGTNLDAELSLRGQTRSDLEENIKIQKTIEELLKEDISFSDEELRTYYDENQSFFGEESSYEDLKEDIREQLMQEKLQQEFGLLLEELRSQSNIYYIVDY